jgi:hypothetical protein
MKLNLGAKLRWLCRSNNFQVDLARYLHARMTIRCWNIPVRVLTFRYRLGRIVDRAINVEDARLRRLSGVRV